MFKHILKLIWNKRRKNLLLFSEIFFCFLVIFAISAFCIKSFRAYFSPIGFDTTPLWVVQQSAISQLDSSAQVATRELLKREIEDINGVEQTSFFGYATPFSNSSWSNGSDAMGFNFYTTLLGGDTDYPSTLGLQLKAGRFFEDQDYEAKYPPVIVNQKIIDQYWPGEQRLDSIIILGDEELKLVGIAENIRYFDGFETEENTSILLHKKNETKDLDKMLIRVAPNSGSELEAKIAKTFQSVLKTEDVTIESMHRNRLRIARATWIPISTFLSIGSFLIINIALGLFGILFYTISKRRGEIGVRRAMGASQSDIIKQFILEIYLVAFFAMLMAILLCVQVPLMNLLDDDFGYSNLYLAIIFAFGLISLVVISCAFWPSKQGANLAPALALHEE